jgi:radical SAM family protein
MRVIRNLEIHATHACNLACESCSHYSNHGHKGFVSLEEADAWLAPWAGRIKPMVFSILGGEPSIHPKLTEFVAVARRHWPRATLRIVTNGFFLHRHPELPEWMARDRNAILNLSVHHDAPSYRERLKPIMDLVAEWERTHRIKVEYWQSNRNWTRRYKGYGAEMKPYEDKQPRRSWEVCTAKFCPQIFEGRLWKCAPLAYLPMQHARFNLSKEWSPYLGYRALDPGCGEAELDAFLAREEESVCNMCAANPERFELPIPIRSEM